MTSPTAPGASSDLVAFLPQPMADQRLPWPSFEFTAAQRSLITRGGLPKLRLAALAPATVAMPNAPTPEVVASLSPAAVTVPARTVAGVTGVSGAPAVQGAMGYSAAQSMPLQSGMIRTAGPQTVTGPQPASVQVAAAVYSPPPAGMHMQASNAPAQTFYATPSLSPATQQSPYTSAAQAASARSISSLSGWSLGLSIAGLLSIWFCIGFVLCITAIVLGHVALYQINQAKLTTWLSPSFRTRAIWGLVVGYGAIIVYILFLIISANGG